MGLRKIYAGIDPGFSGAIALYRDDIDGWKVINCPKELYQIPDIVLILLEMVKEGDFEPVIAIEKVWAQPNNAVRSAFKFGTNYGAWISALSMAGLPYIEVLPSKWQKELKLPKLKKSRKNVLKDHAKKVAEDIKVTLINADAIIIFNWLKNGANNDESNRE